MSGTRSFGGSGGVSLSAANTWTAIQAFGAGEIATSVAINGTGGLGFWELIPQSSPPAAPASGLREYADATGRKSWIRASDGFTRTWDATLTANRVYTLPDATGTIALLNQANTWSSANTFNGTVTISGASLSLSGDISAAAWTTSGIRYANAAATLTDTTSSGTVATAYTDLFGGNTIAASSATTFTNYYTSYFKNPTAGTNVTLTNKFAIGTDSLSVNGNGALSAPGVLLNGTWITGGSATTTKPYALIEPTGTTSGGWSTNGTGLGVNAATGFTGNLLDLQLAGASQFGVDKNGTLTTAGSVIVAGTQIVIASGGHEIRLQTTNNTPFGMHLGSNSAIGWTGTSGNANLAPDTILVRAAAASIQHGAADAAAPVAQTTRVQSVVAGTNNTAGANWTFIGSLSTGTGSPGNTIFQNGFTGVNSNSTVTISNASPAIITWASHGLVPGQVIQFTTTGALPTGLSLATNYYVIAAGLTSGAFEVSATNGGAAVNTSSAGSGTHTATTQVGQQNAASTILTLGPSGLTGSLTTPAVQINQVWNTSGDATALLMNITNTTSAAASRLFDLQVGGVSSFYSDAVGTLYLTSQHGVHNPIIRFLQGASDAINAAQIAAESASSMTFSTSGQRGLTIDNSNGRVVFSSTYIVGWSATTDTRNAADTGLFRDAAGTLAQRNGVNAQTHRVYNTWTDASNGEWGTYNWADTANVLTIGTKMNGTGVARNMQFVIGGVNKLDYGVTNGGQWTFSTNSITFSDGISIVNGDMLAVSGRSIGWQSSFARMKSPADGIIDLLNNAETDFNRLQFGGTTSSFPALKRNATALEAWLADASALTKFKAQHQTHANAVAETITPDHTLVLYDAAGTAYRVPCQV